jgi:hypothetical protein
MHRLRATQQQQDGRSTAVQSFAAQKELLAVPISSIPLSPPLRLELRHPPLQRPRVRPCLPRLARLLPHRRLQPPQPCHQQAHVGGRRRRRCCCACSSRRRQRRDKDDKCREHTLYGAAPTCHWPPHHTAAPPRCATSCCPGRGGWQRHLLLRPGIPSALPPAGCAAGCDRCDRPADARQPNSIMHDPHAASRDPIAGNGSIPLQANGSPTRLLALGCAARSSCAAARAASGSHATRHTGVAQSSWATRPAEAWTTLPSSAWRTRRAWFM